jgi:hypothetical protein
MIDVNKITSTLAKLPDQQLQQYAQMHKADPYIMALAMSESNRRKELRSAGQGPAQEQPKVVDQMVAEMAPQQLPEDQGIGQLPAGDMNFADGGIIAFADGGDVERYQSRGLVSPDAYWASPDSDEGVKTAFRTNVRVGEKYTPGLFDSLFGYNVLPSEESSRSQTSAEMAAKASASPYTTPASAATAPLASPRAMLNQAEQAARKNAAVYSAPKAAPTADTGRAGPGVAAPAVAAGLPGIQDLATMRQGIYDKQKFVDPAKAEVDALGKEMVEGAQRRKQDFEDYNKAQGDVYKDRSDRLVEREKSLAKQSDQNTGLAFLNAGLAIMSTPGGLATAIGKGARVGTEMFAAGLDKIRAAQERLADAKDKMDDLRLNRADMTFKERSALSADISKAKQDAKKMGIDGVRMAADVNEKRASDIFSKSVDMTKTVYEQQQQNARSAAQIQASLNTPDRLVFNQLLKKNDNDAVKAAEALQKMKAEKFNMYEAYSKYLTGFAGKETVTPPQTFDQFASQFVVPTTKAPGKGATVLQQS